MHTTDRIAPLLQRFRVQTSLFFSGAICGVTSFAARPGRGFLHVLRRGEMVASHRRADGSMEVLQLDQPTLLFYPRPWEHTFANAPTDGADFTCAALDFDGGETHPLLQTLPPVIAIPLADVAGLDPVLRLLFDEVDNVRCGRRLVADRLFEVVLIRLLRWMLDHVAELGLPPGLFAGLADPRLTPVLTGVHRSPERNWSLAAMAQEANMSRSAFAAHFTATVGMAPGEYVTQWRLTIAQGRLRAGAGVAEVARELGYGNASSFSRAFAQRLGASPRDWVRAAG